MLNLTKHHNYFSVDGMEHNFELNGVGQTSLSVETIKCKVKCRGVVQQTVKVPNYSHATLNYDVYSNIDFLEGPTNLVVPVSYKLLSLIYFTIFHF